MDDLNRDEISASQKLVIAAIKRKSEISRGLFKLLKTIKEINSIVDEISVLNEDEKSFLNVGIEILYSEHDEDYCRFAVDDLNSKDIKRICEELYEIDMSKESVYGKITWDFDYNDEQFLKSDLFKRFNDFAEKLENKYGLKDEHLEMESFDYMFSMEFYNYQVVQILSTMTSWLNKVFRPFIMTKIDPDSIYYND